MVGDAKDVKCEVFRVFDPSLPTELLLENLYRVWAWAETVSSKADGLGYMHVGDTYVDFQEIVVGVRLTVVQDSVSGPYWAFMWKGSPIGLIVFEVFDDGRLPSELFQHIKGMVLMEHYGTPLESICREMDDLVKQYFGGDAHDGSVTSSICSVVRRGILYSRLNSASPIRRKKFPITVTSPTVRSLLLSLGRLFYLGKVDWEWVDSKIVGVTVPEVTGVILMSLSDSILTHSGVSVDCPVYSITDGRKLKGLVDALYSEFEKLGVFDCSLASADLCHDPKFII